MFKAVPERPVYFNGMTAEASDKPTFDMDAKINYPMLGGTALITFEDEAGELIRKLPSAKFLI